MKQKKSTFLVLSAKLVEYIRPELTKLHQSIGEDLIDDNFGDREEERNAARVLHAKLGRALGIVNV